MSKLDTLDKEFRAKIDRVLNTLDEQKRKYTIIEALRSKAVQSAYYAQGMESLETVNALRTACGLWKITEAENKRRITWTLDSKHLLGLAVDIAPIVNGKIPWNINTKEIADLWKAIGSAAKKEGLVWGGDWKPIDIWGVGKDAPHIEQP